MAVDAKSVKLHCDVLSVGYSPPYDLRHTFFDDILLLLFPRPTLLSLLVGHSSQCFIQSSSIFVEFCIHAFKAAINNTR